MVGRIDEPFEQIDVAGVVQHAEEVGAGRAPLVIEQGEHRPERGVVLRLVVDRVRDEALSQHFHVPYLAERATEPAEIVLQGRGPPLVEMRAERPQVTPQSPGRDSGLVHVFGVFTGSRSGIVEDELGDRRRQRVTEDLFDGRRPGYPRGRVDIGVNDHTPCVSVGTVVAMRLPSIVKSTAVLARPVPVSASFEVILSLADEPVSNARLSVTVGPVVLSVKTTGVLVPVLPAVSVSLATMLWLPLPDSVTLVLQLPSFCTIAVPTAVAPSRMVTVVPASVASTTPVIVCAAWLIGPPALLIAITGAVVSSVKLSA